EHRALRIRKNGDATTIRPVHGLHERGTAKLVRFGGRPIRVVDRDIGLPARRHRGVRKGYEPPDAGLSALEDPVAAVLGPHVGRAPAEDLAVEALRAVDVRRAELIPNEDALGAGAVALGLVRADEGALRVSDDCDASDLAHLERAGRELAACTLRLLDRLVHVLDPN